MDSMVLNFSQPFLLIDFLKDCYHKGGVYSVLALNGIFVLMTKFNFDFPSFYKELYALFKPSLFHMKYRGKFFALADLFLSSEFLPAYVVAAFVKRLARLALSAPVPGAILAITLIHNLMVHHAPCQVLLHKAFNQERPVTSVLLIGSASEIVNDSEDPYIFEEQDPAKCAALQSSLWEILVLQNNTYPEVSKLAKSLVGKLTNLHVISDYAASSYQSLFKRDSGLKQTSFPMDYEDANQGVFFPTQDLFGGWKWQ
jgi:U3 small nucleolar RNA-associated protein 19